MGSVVDVGGDLGGRFIVVEESAGGGKGGERL